MATKTKKSVHAKSSSTVTWSHAESGSTVHAWSGSTVHAKSGSTVTAWSGSTVHAPEHTVYVDAAKCVVRDV